MKAPWTDPGLRELLALAALAASGCGLALALDDLMFTAIFAAAWAVTIVGLMRYLRWRIRAEQRALGDSGDFLPPSPPAEKASAGEISWCRHQKLDHPPVRFN
jgi:hypothetical protein